MPYIVFPQYYLAASSSHLQESGGEGSPGGHVDMWPDRSETRSLHQSLHAAGPKSVVGPEGRPKLAKSTNMEAQPADLQREARRTAYTSSSPFLSERRKCLWACGLCYAIHGLGSPSTCQHPGACLTVPISFRAVNLSCSRSFLNFFGGIK